MNKYKYVKSNIKDCNLRLSLGIWKDILQLQFSYNEGSP